MTLSQPGNMESFFSFFFFFFPFPFYSAKRLASPAVALPGIIYGVLSPPQVCQWHCVVSSGFWSSVKD